MYFGLAWTSYKGLIKYRLPKKEGNTDTLLKKSTVIWDSFRRRPFPCKLAANTYIDEAS